MNYKKTTCPTCLTSVTNLDLLLGEAAKQAGVTLYDFGAGITISPVPPVYGESGSQGMYLTDHMVAVESPITEDMKFYKITAVRFSYNDLTLEDMVSKLKKAAEHNKTQEKQLEFIQ